MTSRFLLLLADQDMSSPVPPEIDIMETESDEVMILESGEVMILG
jgi:hypothetical protein